MLILKEEWRTHPKMLHAVYVAGTEAVKHFWFEAVSECGEAKTDGVIEVYRLPLIARSCGLDVDSTKAFVDALVRAGLLHDAEALAGCRSCKTSLKEQGCRPGPDDLVVHDFLEHNPSKRNKNALGKKREKRKNDLGPGRRSEWVKQAIYERDMGLCRYCGRRPNPDTFDKPDSLQHDHLDPACFEPNHGNFVDGMVIACRRCNRAKGERTPEEAGMGLLAIGITWIDVRDGQAVYVDTPDEAASAAARLAAAFEGSTVAEGVGPGSGPARAGLGSGSRRDRASTPGRGAKGGTSRPGGGSAQQKGPSP